MNVVATLDIEIIQDPKAVQYIPEKGKNERTEPWDKLKFDSNFNVMCCWAMFDGEETLSDVMDPVHGEYAVLESLWDAVRNYDQIITFNGLSFDVPFILKRSWYAQVVPSKKLNLKRYVTPDRNTNHIDLRCLLSNWDNTARGSLDLYAKLALGCGKGGIEGAMVQGMWDEGKREEIRHYCEADARLTWDLYQRMIGYYI